MVTRDYRTLLGTEWRGTGIKRRCFATRGPLAGKYVSRRFCLGPANWMHTQRGWMCVRDDGGRPRFVEAQECGTRISASSRTTSEFKGWRDWQDDIQRCSTSGKFRR